MKSIGIIANLDNISPFNRNFFDTKEEFTYISTGSFGGKASGLALAHSVITENVSKESFLDIKISVPVLTVIRTDMFDNFMKENNLYEIAYSNNPDDIIAHEFQNANLPVELVGDLRALISKVNSPLAVRSSSLLEDALYEPFAGIYGTKMIPNNQPDTDSRFKKLTESIKFVYASTYFKKAKDYIRATRNKIEDEKMAIIVQEIVGLKHNGRFYPNISGVARSFNYYPVGRTKPEDGVVNLALGLGKTIVDGDICWTYSPSHPKASPPFASAKSILDLTQKEFWSVNMGKPPEYDPIHETEYLFKLDIQEAENDGTLNDVASTYDAESDRIYPGIAKRGSRVINFAPLLILNTIQINDLLKYLLRIFEDKLNQSVEIEFAMSIRNDDVRFGFLQVRPMVISNENVEITDEEFNSKRILLTSSSTLGNGIRDDIKDIVLVKPEAFNTANTRQIASEVEEINNELLAENVPYLLIGFGRWGSSDPWLGIPVNWGQISGAKVIVESMISGMNVELSQGSHFFHNISSFQVLYFSIPFSENKKINWSLLDDAECDKNMQFVKHLKLKSTLTIKTDGKTGRGIILKND